MTKTGHEPDPDPGSTTVESVCPDVEHPDRTRRGRGRWTTTGLLAPPLFVLTFSVDGALRRNYEPVSMFVSELSIGPGGWVQQLNFLVSGALMVCFAFSLPRATDHRRAKSVVVVLTLFGGCLAASALFTTDPSAMFSQVTVPGRIHGILGAVAFLCMPVSCFLVASRLTRPHGLKGMTRWTRTVGALLVVLIVTLKISELPSTPLFAWKGLVQRASLTLYLSWVSTFAVVVRSGRLRPTR